MGNTIENLLSRVVALEDCFDSPPSGVPEQRRRSDLIRYAIVPSLLPALIPPQQAQCNRGTTAAVV